MNNSTKSIMDQVWDAICEQKKQLTDPKKELIIYLGHNELASVLADRTNMAYRNDDKRTGEIGLFGYPLVEVAETSYLKVYVK